MSPAWFGGAAETEAGQEFSGSLAVGSGNVCQLREGQECGVWCQVLPKSPALLFVCSCSCTEILGDLCSGVSIITALIPFGGRVNLVLQSVPAFEQLPRLPLDCLHVVPDDTSYGNGPLEL